MEQYKKDYPLGVIDEDNAIDGYTPIQPYGWKYKPHIPVQHYDEDLAGWVLESETEDAVAIDKIHSINQVQLVGILDAMGDLPKLTTLLENSSVFNLSWSGAGGCLNLRHPLVLSALESVDIDIVAVKRSVLNA